MISRFRVNWLVLAGLLLLGAPSVPQAEVDTDELLMSIEESVMCVCGCANMVLSTCRCGFSPQMRAEIREIVAEGKNKEEAIQVLVERYGEVVLAVPKQEGFNLTAYTMPFVAMFGGGILLVLLIRGWKRGSREKDLKPAEDKELYEDDPYRERLEQELKSFKD